MPQFNPEFFLSQVFWLVITFSFLLIFLWRISLPRISSVLEKRENKINDEIQTAKKLQSEAKGIQAKIDQQLFTTHEQVVKLIKETTNNLQSKVSTQLQTIDSELAKNIDESAKAIEKTKNNTLKDIKLQIQEITKLTLSKLTTINVSDKEIHDAIRTIQNKTIN